MAASRRCQIANAALMEIGHEPIVTDHPADPGRLRYVAIIGLHDRAAAHKAAMLAHMAVDGPDFMVRCLACSPRLREEPPCMTVRDVLMGRPCPNAERRCDEQEAEDRVDCR